MAVTIKYLTVFIYFATTNVSIQSQIIHPLLQIRHAAQLDSVCIQQGSYCIDCRTMRICTAQGGIFVSEDILCKTQSANHPYCDMTTNECTSQSDVCETQTECYSEGYLPDPYNCRNYMICVYIHGELLGKVYSCGSDETVSYNHIIHGCQQNTQCLDFTENRLCKNNSGRIVTYPKDESIWAICPQTENGNITANKCMSPYEFNVTAMRCKPVCRSNGKIADLEDSLNFYECIKIGTDYIMLKRQCPEGSMFNADKKICASYIPGPGPSFITMFEPNNKNRVSRSIDWWKQNTDNQWDDSSTFNWWPKPKYENTPTWWIQLLNTQENSVRSGDQQYVTPEDNNKLARKLEILGAINQWKTQWQLKDKKQPKQVDSSEESASNEDSVDSSEEQWSIN